MQPSRLLFRLAGLLLPVALVATTWLYLYPILHGCAFPQPTAHGQSTAPFRLLALGDPQLEGDSSLPDPNALLFPSLENVGSDLRYANYELLEARDILLAAAKGVVKDALVWLEGQRKKIDLWGNDLYLAHIVRSLRWWTEPTHISVLGDLLGSQWITNGEFEKRAGRYWGTVMRGLEKVPDHIMGVVVDDYPEEPKKTWGGTTEVLGADKSWETRVINIAGNHDVGYAGDLDHTRIERFERAFGSVNWDIWFTLPPSAYNETSVVAPPALRLVILNTMNLDAPAWIQDIQSETYEYMNHVITSSRSVNDKTHATILLTHIPLTKEPGTCVDSPLFSYFESGHGIKEQNMLSDHGSRTILEGIFGLNGNKDVEGSGMGRKGIILNGHDHEGCDVVHYIRQPGGKGECQMDAISQADAYWPVSMFNATEPTLPTDTLPNVGSLNETATDDQSESQLEPEPESVPAPEPEPADAPPQWQARRFPTLPHDITPSGECTTIDASPHLREVTLRSMMGEFSGYAGFLSAWFDPAKGEKGEWVMELSTCGVGVQHWWWAVHIVDLILVLAALGGAVSKAIEAVAAGQQSNKKKADGCIVHNGKAQEIVDGKDERLRNVNSG
jgi:hypothetical protein